MVSEVQSIGFYRKPYGTWTAKQAKEWLKNHNYNFIDSFTTGSMIHFKINEPSQNKYTKYVSKVMGQGNRRVLLVIGVNKELKGGAVSRGGNAEASSVETLQEIAKEEMKNTNMQNAFSQSLEKIGAPASEILSDTNNNVTKDTPGIDEAKLIPDLKTDKANKREQVNYSKKSFNMMFPPDTLLGYIASGKMGFPFRTGMSTFTSP